MGAKAMHMKKDTVKTVSNPILSVASTKPIQRKFGDKYGKARVNDDLKQHMNGEWDGKEGKSLKGGHWLPGMKKKWGSNVKLDKEDDNKTDGIYFSALPKSSGNLLGFTHGKKPSWYVRKDGKKSAVKAQSSFWPSSWSWSDFETHLGESVERNQAHQWDTTTYAPGKISWDSTNSETNAFPIGFENNHGKPKD